MNKFFVKIISLVSISIFITLAFIVLLNLNTVSAKTVTFDLVVEKINQDQVVNIKLTGNKIEVSLKDGTTLISNKADNISFSEYLIKQGASYEKLQNITIEIQEKDGFMSTLLFTFYPIGIFLIWFFVAYAIMLGGNKIFQLEIPTRKFFLYLAIFFTFEILWNDYLSGLINQSLLTYLLQVLVFATISVLLLKYYFLLVGKKLWQFFIYLFVVNALLSVMISFFFS